MRGETAVHSSKANPMKTNTNLCYHWVANSVVAPFDVDTAWLKTLMGSNWCSPFLEFMFFVRNKTKKIDYKSYEKVYLLEI